MSCGHDLPILLDFSVHLLLNANIKVDGGKEIHHNVRAVTKGEGLGIFPEHEPPAILMKQTNKQNQGKVEPDKSQV